MTDEYRLQQLERQLVALQERSALIPVLQEKIANQGHELSELKGMVRDGFAEAKEDGKATRRTVMAFAFTVAGSSVAVLLTLLTTGAIG
jgi:hypothetical protein